MSDSVSHSGQPPFIPKPFLVLLDGLVREHVLLTHPFVVTIRIPLPLDQVLSGFLSPVEAYIQNLLDLVFFLIGNKIRGRTLIIPSVERSLPIWGKEVNVEHRVDVPGRGKT